MYRRTDMTLALVLASFLVACGSAETEPTTDSADPTAVSDTTDPSDTGDASDTDATAPIDSVLEDPLRVRSVIDGDTFEILRDDEVIRVRMKGIDTPELYGDNDSPEPCAQAAKDFLWDTIGNSEVGLEFDSSCGSNPYLNCYDGYDRLLAYVRLHNGDDLAALLLTEGLARVYRFNNETFDRLADYNAAEQAAKISDRGIWANAGQQCR